MVGMASVVTRSVPDFALVVGNPARCVGYVCRCGNPLLRSPNGRLPRSRTTMCRLWLFLQSNEKQHHRIDSEHLISSTEKAEYLQRQQRWAIIGGGFLGMTLALRLVQQGNSVTLFEAAPSLGGLASAWQLGDVVWDRHYHVTLSSDRYLRSLLRELGLETEIQWATTRTGFYVDSELHSLSNTLEFLKFPGLNLLDKVRLGATILHASRIADGKALEGIPVIVWLEKWSGRNVVDKIWLPLLRAKLEILTARLLPLSSGPASLA